MKKYYVVVPLFFLLLSGILYLITNNLIFSIISFFVFSSIHLYIFYRINKLKHYEKIYRTVSYLPRFTDTKSLLDFVVSAISELLSAQRTTLFLVNRETNTLWTLIAEQLEIKEFSLPIGKGIAGYVAQTGEIVNIKDDPYKDSRFLPVIDMKTGFRTKTILCAPIRDPQNKIVAVVEVLNKKSPGGFTEEDIEILKVFCSEIGSVITNTQLYESLQHLLESLLKSFAAAVDARDPATRGHSLRVTKYALNIARAMNLSPTELKKLEYAAVLHDVGKIGVPDSVLLKPDRFTKEEYEIMKSHALLTQEILSKIYFPEEYKDVPFIASTHHEFLDGSGYPFGLKGDQIPLLSRILCIADIYDALISYDRPYKPPYTQQQATEIMYKMQQEGKLDKDILDIFVTKKLYQIERRNYVRVDKEFSFSWRRLSEEDIKSVLPILAKTKNISAGGLRFISNEEISENSFIEVEVYLPNYTIETLAKVVHCKPLEKEKSYDIGIAFINLSKETRERLNKYLVEEIF